MDPNRDWSIEIDPTGPGFTALWVTGNEALAAIKGPRASLAVAGRLHEAIDPVDRRPAVCATSINLDLNLSITHT